MRRTAALFVLAAGLVLGLASSLAGCALVAIGSDGVDSVTTGSITPAATPLPVSPAPAPPSKSVVGSLAQSDWEAIRAVAADRLKSAANGSPLDWSNPDTGNSGSIAAVAGARSRAGDLVCRPFALTVSDVRGVRLYHGDACRSQDDSWQLFDLTADDKTLL